MEFQLDLLQLLKWEIKQNFEGQDHILRNILVHMSYSDTIVMTGGVIDV